MWEVRADRAIGSWGGGQLELALSEPSRGIVRVDLAGRELPVRPLLGLELPGARASGVRPIREVYVRGDDLIVSYAETADQVGIQIDWRLLPTSNWAPAGGVELVLSVQTQSLDARPQAIVRSGPAASEHSQPCPGVCLFRLSSGELSYVEMSGLSDVERTVARLRDGTANGYEQETELDLGRLEKGVIRRCRLRAYWLPRDGDEPAALGLWREFQASPLPLTA